MPRRPTTSPLFPYNDALPISGAAVRNDAEAVEHFPVRVLGGLEGQTRGTVQLADDDAFPGSGLRGHPAPEREDRKSTRLNSSHLGISYAVFCLKKKKNKNNK